VWVRSGGEGFAPKDKKVPVVYNLAQPAQPDDTRWLD
jgi:hypothetical protein